MPTRRKPRKGSLQFWPRKRASKFLPSVNWNAIESGSQGFKGFIGYKAGMFSVHAKDNTPDSMTKGKLVAIPVTILECPPMKIFSIRFYKDGKVAKDILTENFEKELKKKIKLPKKKTQKIDDIKAENFDDVSVIVYSNVKKTNIKKTPDMVEIGLSGKISDKLEFIKSKLNKEISVLDVFEKGELVDIRGITKGKGIQGPVKRFGVTLRPHKSEKGVRKIGSIGPWHPSRVTFRVPMAGQMGLHTRICYNKKIVDIGNSEGKEKLEGIKNYGNVKTDYILIAGSAQGPAKRQVVLTRALRPTKKQSKKTFEVIKIK